MLGGVGRENPGKTGPSSHQKSVDSNLYGVSVHWISLSLSAHTNTCIYDVSKDKWEKRYKSLVARRCTFNHESKCYNLPYDLTQRLAA